jgi:hypothetical protein
LERKEITGFYQHLREEELRGEEVIRYRVLGFLRAVGLTSKTAFTHVHAHCFLGSFSLSLTVLNSFCVDSTPIQPSAFTSYAVVTVLTLRHCILIVYTL